MKWKRNEEDPNVGFFINMQKLDVNLEFNRKKFLMIITKMIDCQCDLPRNHVQLSLHKLLRTIAFFCSWVDDFLVLSNMPPKHIQTHKPLGSYHDH